ncbi:Aquaporin-1 [Microbotryomycetes sp. JL221]|nr:Aquaporin-1 [Microbotryomycetes sp. JL221]
MATTGAAATTAPQAHNQQRPWVRFGKPQEHGPGWEDESERAQFDGPYPYDRAGKPRELHIHRPKHGSRPASIKDQQPYTGDKEKRDQPHHEHPHHHGRRTRRVAKHIIHDMLAVTGEFFGTFLFLFMSFMGAQSATYNRGGTGGGDQTVTTNDNQTILFIALSFGMSLIVVAWAFFRITGAAFNPAVTFALWLIGNLSLRRAVGTAVAQLLGGIAAAAVTKGVTLGNFAVTNALTPGVSTGQGLGIELLTTAMLTFTVLMTAAEKSKATFLAPVAIGLALFVGHLASIGWTGAGINPARTLGPSVVTPQFPSNAWLYYLGQFLGALLATVAYAILKALDYTEVAGAVDTENADASADTRTAPVTNLLNAMPGVDLNRDNDAASIASGRQATTREQDLEAQRVDPLSEEPRRSRDTESTSVAQ